MRSRVWGRIRNLVNEAENNKKPIPKRIPILKKKHNKILI
ncbi:hypothetical protein LEP1GSC053_2684 [Leptospira interrogans serovar Muenchen str. Brem 129]|nr:hypothetical protein LEP1GSC053_2684 [Leptospira interrogans serovar Muenchen str. Brem 129]